MIIAAIGRLQGNAPGRATVEAVFIEQWPFFLDMAAPEDADLLFGSRATINDKSSEAEI